jgi:molybdopterin molybdotransferase
VYELISVEVALEKILDNVNKLEAEEIDLLESLGYVLAEDVYSEIDVPSFASSVFDGYVVRSVDIAGASRDKPAKLKVIDMIAAGGLPNKKVVEGTASRIMTGAPMPDGADCIIRFEDTDEEEQKLSGSGIPDVISIYIEEGYGANARIAGENIKKGELLHHRGKVIRPSEIGMLASMGCDSVKVVRKPVVAVLATGNELINPGETLQKGKIYNSNSFGVAAQIKRDGAVPKLIGIARDDEASLISKIEEAYDADLLVTIGGVSMGDYDVVKNVLAKQGEIVFWKVKTKPGKPLAFGKIKRGNKFAGGKDLPHVGLAGNAVSCMVNYELFVRPAIFKMMGKNNFNKPSIVCTMQDEIRNPDGRRVFSRVIVEKKYDGYYARLTGPQGSGILTSMTLANGLAVVPEDKNHVYKGDQLEVMMLDWVQDL